MKREELKDVSKVERDLASFREWRLKADAQQVADRLVKDAESLAQHLLQVAETVRRGRMPNGLGEVQSMGSRIDVLCAQLVQARETLIEFDAVTEGKYILEES